MNRTLPAGSVGSVFSLFMNYCMQTFTIRLLVLWLVGISLGVTPVRADVRLPKLITDGMVLQRDVPLNIWGWADPGEVVTVLWAGKSYRATTGPDRTWRVQLPAQRAGGPYSMTIEGRNTLTLTELLVGDVWLCSGQSNMELPMNRVVDLYADLMATANYPTIRQFNVPTRYSFGAVPDDVPPGRWEAVTPKTIGTFTAVGFFFAKSLHEKYGVPIGLIKASVGGSPAEAWLSDDALKAFPVHEAVAQKMADSAYVARIRQADDARSRIWYTQLGQTDKGRHGAQPWFDPAYDASRWPRMNLPGYWADEPDPALKKLNGVVWFRKEFDVPAALAGQPARLRLGTIVDRDSAYLNGTFVGTIGYQYPPRKYDIPAGGLRPGKNTLVVRVINNIGRGGFTPDKPYQLEVGGQVIDLKGSWQYQVGAEAQPLQPQTFFQYMPGGLYKGMIAPLLPYAFKGVIWYQGESNVSRATEYRDLFSAVISDWRGHWQGATPQAPFPFLFVQLANYLPVQKDPVDSDWAQLREAQRQTLALPNTGMAVAIDLGEWNDIHPLNKADVGKRLALAAERVAYGNKTGITSGPVFASMRQKGNRLVLRFRETGGGLVSRNSPELKQFAVAEMDPDGKLGPYVWANARIRGNTVEVWHDDVRRPVAVRYAWADNPEGANLYNREGLPASPFAAQLPVSR